MNRKLNRQQQLQQKQQPLGGKGQINYESASFILTKAAAHFPFVNEQQEQKDLIQEKNLSLFLKYIVQKLPPPNNNLELRSALRKMKNIADNQEKTIQKNMAQETNTFFDDDEDLQDVEYIDQNSENPFSDSVNHFENQQSSSAYNSKIRESEKEQPLIQTKIENKQQVPNNQEISDINSKQPSSTSSSNSQNLKQNKRKFQQDKENINYQYQNSSIKKKIKTEDTSSKFSSINSQSSCQQNNQYQQQSDYFSPQQQANAYNNNNNNPNNYSPLLDNYSSPIKQNDTQNLLLGQSQGKQQPFQQQYQNILHNQVVCNHHHGHFGPHHNHTHHSHNHHNMNNGYNNHSGQHMYHQHDHQSHSQQDQQSSIYEMFSTSASNQNHNNPIGSISPNKNYYDPIDQQWDNNFIGGGDDVGGFFD